MSNDEGSSNGGPGSSSSSSSPATHPTSSEEPQQLPPRTRVVTLEGVLPSHHDETTGTNTNTNTHTNTSTTDATGLRQRPSTAGTFVSRHRKVLERIKTDSAQSRIHAVPVQVLVDHHSHAHSHSPTGGVDDAAAGGPSGTTTVGGNNSSNNNTSSGNHSTTNHPNYHGNSGGGASSYSNAAASLLRSALNKCVVGTSQDHHHHAHHHNNHGGGDDAYHGDYEYDSDEGDPKSPAQKCSDFTERILPMWAWLQTYKFRQDFSSDLIAGLTVGVMIIPQSMSYAKLAGLPVEFGLYSALVPVYAYALFGSSRQLAVGPVALISLLLSSGLSAVMIDLGYDKETDDPEVYQTAYNQLAVQVSFLVGLCYIVMGLLRLGFVTIFLSHAVVSGFTTGAAVIIGMSQVKYILGFDIDSSKQLHVLVKNLVSGLDQFNYRTFLMGMGSIGLLVYLKYVGKTYARFKFVRALGPLTVTAVGILLVVIFGLDERRGGEDGSGGGGGRIPVVGDIPSGLPSFTVQLWTPIEGGIQSVMVVVISIVIVGFMESIAIAKQLASKHKYEIDSSLELIGLGMANFLGGMVNGYPVTGSFSRSAVNNESGAKSGISGMVTATLVMVALLCLTSVFELLPLNVLASIVISGVLGLIDTDEAMYLWKVHKLDFGVWVFACVGTMFFGVEIGLAIAVGLSLLIVIYESAYPHTSVLGRLPGTSTYRNVKQYPDAERYDGMVLMRIDAPLYFANAQNVRDKIRKYRLAAERSLARRNGGAVKYLILEMAPVGHLDTTALHILEDMNTNYCSRGQQLLFTNPSLKVMDCLTSSGFADKVGREHFFTSLHDAVNWALQEMDCEATSLHESSMHEGGGRGLHVSRSDDEGLEQGGVGGTAKDVGEEVSLLNAAAVMSGDTSGGGTPLLDHDGLNTTASCSD